MLRRASSATVALVLFTACAEPVTSPAPTPPDPSLARSTAVTVSWKIPLADTELALRSDRRFGDGTYSVYEGGVCNVSTTIFSGEGGSGDATIRTSEPKGGKCGRLFRLRYPDGQSEDVWSFGNLLRLHNVAFWIPVGETVRRRFLFNPEVVSSPSRCGRLIFGPNLKDGVIVGAGSDSLLVTRVDSRTWQVRSQPAPDNRALCESTGEIFAMPVSFVVAASQDIHP